MGTASKSKSPKVAKNLAKDMDSAAKATTAVQQGERTSSPAFKGDRAEPSVLPILRFIEAWLPEYNLADVDKVQRTLKRLQAKGDVAPKTVWWFVQQLKRLRKILNTANGLSEAERVKRVQACSDAINHYSGFSESGQVSDSSSDEGYGGEQPRKAAAGRTPKAKTNALDRDLLADIQGTVTAALQDVQGIITAELGGIQDDIKSTKQSVETMTEAVTDMSATVEAVEKEFDKFKGRVKKYSQRVKAVEKAVEELRDAKHNGSKRRSSSLSSSSSQDDSESESSDEERRTKSKRARSGKQDGKKGGKFGKTYKPGNGGFKSSNGGNKPKASLNVATGGSKRCADAEGSQPQPWMVSKVKHLLKHMSTDELVRMAKAQEQPRQDNKASKKSRKDE